MSTEPKVIEKGMSYAWSKQIEGRSSDTYELKYRLVNSLNSYPAGDYVTASADGSGGYDVALDPVFTASLAAGDYQLAGFTQLPGAVAEADQDREPVPVVTVTVREAGFGTTAQDYRTFAERMFDAAEAALEARADAQELDLVRSAIGDSSAERNTAKLVALRDRWRIEAMQARRARALARGEQIPNTLAVRFS